MSNSQSDNVEMNQRLTESLLQVNSLMYQLPPSLGIASVATHVVDFSQQSSYSGTNRETVIVDVQTANFVDASASYFKFEVKPNDAGFGFASGSCANIFARVCVRSKQGKEICRLESAGLITKFFERWNYSKQWLDSIGKVQGYSDAKFTAGSVSNTLQYGDEVPTSGKVFILPVQAIIPAFSIIGSKMLPPQMMSGLRLELTLESPNKCFASTNQASLASLSGYTVNAFTCNWKNFVLADAFTRQVNIMASNGLNVMHKEYFHTIVSATSGTQINTDIKKSASKALKCMIVTRLESDIKDDGRDTFRSAPYDYTSFQAHCGTQFYPHQPIVVKDTSSNGNAEAYYYTAYGLDKLEHFHPPSVSRDEFTGYADASNNNVGWNNGMIVFNINKSNVSDLAGMQLNNSRALLLDLTREGTEPIRMDCYLQFLRLSKYTQTSCIVLD